MTGASEVGNHAHQRVAHQTGNVGHRACQGEACGSRSALEEGGWQAEKYRYRANDGRRSNGEQYNGHHQVLAKECRTGHGDGADDKWHDDVPAALAMTIRTSADQQHPSQSSKARNSRQQTNMERVGHPRIADEGRHPEAHGISTEQDGKIDTTEHPHLEIEKTISEAVLATLAFCIVRRQVTSKFGLLFVA
ncbi:hypothetical protein D3C77_567210 [compost metagenome]